MVGTTLNPGQSLELKFSVEVVKYRDSNDPFTNRAAADYNDWVNVGTQKHPPIYSNLMFYPAGMPAVYPNPFNLYTAINGRLKFENLERGTVIYIYTVSAELLKVIGPVDSPRAYWQGDNYKNQQVEAGVYFYVAKQLSGKVYKGKIYVIKNK